MPRKPNMTSLDRVTSFMRENRNKAYCTEEVARAIGISSNTTYMILRRLRSNGLIQSKWVDTSLLLPEGVPRPKRNMSKTYWIWRPRQYPRPAVSRYPSIVEQPETFCMICNSPIMNSDAVEDAKLIEKHTKKATGVLCCSCRGHMRWVDKYLTNGGDNENETNTDN